MLLGASTLIAFVVCAAVLGDSMGDTLVAWAVIFGIIAVLWTARWKGQEYRRFRDELMARDEVVERAMERRERGEQFRHGESLQRIYIEPRTLKLHVHAAFPVWKLLDY